MSPGSRDTANGALDALVGLPSALSVVDVSACDEASLGQMLGAVRAAQRSLDGLVMRIGVRSNRLAAAGSAAPAEEFLRGAGAVGARAARREAARAETADAIRGLEDAVLSGRTSAEHVDCLARHGAKLTEEQRAVFDFESLVERSADLPPETFDRLVKRRVDAVVADHGLADTKAKQAASEFTHWFDRQTGMGRFSGSLDPERYEALTDAIDQQMAVLATSSDGPVTKTKNLAAEALVGLVLAAGGRDARNRLPSVTVIVDHQTLQDGPHSGSVRQTAAGHDLPPESLARLCCDATLRRVTLDERGVPIDVGRKYRTATDAQWAAIKAVHTTCAWDGCTAPISWCQAHHVHEWEHGGHTDLDNLVPLCTRHHHQVHEGRWRIELLPDRSLRILRPDGVLHRTVPTPMRC